MKICVFSVLLNQADSLLRRGCDDRVMNDCCKRLLYHPGPAFYFCLSHGSPGCSAGNDLITIMLCSLGVEISHGSEDSAPSEKRSAPASMEACKSHLRETVIMKTGKTRKQINRGTRILYGIQYPAYEMTYKWILVPVLP